jgi:transposase InsO family protein
MPWKVMSVVKERMRFIGRLQDGERMTDLCREYGISRKTGYKLKSRYEVCGVASFEDRSRAPHRRPHATPPEVIEAIVELKAEFPTWGAKKLRAMLPSRHPGLHVPARSTVHEILKGKGLIQPRKRRRRCSGYSKQLTRAEKPNDVWCIDFKGEFRLGNGDYCYPVTITDQASRFVLACEGYSSTATIGAKMACTAAFKAHGLPRVIRSDNGTPFASTGLAGLSRLNAWWLRLGIDHERIEPGHPEQNGRHERMHLTLKQETTRPAARNLLAQQERFDRWAELFNTTRPHEALGMEVPASRYTPSPRALPRRLPTPAYPLHDLTRQVRDGRVRFNGQRHYLSSALEDESVGLRQLDADRWLATFTRLDLAVINTRTLEVEPVTALQTPYLELTL